MVKRFTVVIDWV